MTRIIKILVLFILFGCGAGIGDSTVELSNEYFYRTDGGMRYILPNSIFKEGIYPNVVKYAYDEKFILIIQVPKKELIRSFLAEDIMSRYISIVHTIDSSFVDSIEYQKINNAYISDSNFYNNLKKIISLNNTLSDRKECSKIANSIIDTSTYYQKIINSDSCYWIISHDLDSKFGPFSKKEFLNKAKEFKVSKELKMKLIN